MASIKKSFCHLCLAECGIKITVEDNKFAKISPDFDDPISQGYVCEKSQKLIGFQHNTDRITGPLKKIDGAFVPISWEQAIDEISIRLKPYLNQTMYMAPLSPSYSASTEYSYELMAHLGVKFASNVLSYEKAYTLLTHQFFFNVHVTPDRQETQTLILIGQNPWVTQHYPQARKILNNIKNDPTKTLIVIDPADTETAKIATYHLKLKPGTDAWLLSAIIKLLIETGGVDYNFINKQTLNFDNVRDHFSNLDLTEYLKICGVDLDNLIQIVNIIKTSKSVSIDMGNGICHSPFPFANNYLIILLYLITGNYQKLGTMQSAVSLSSSQNYLMEGKTPITKQMQFNGIMASPLISNNLDFKCVIIDNCNPVSRIPNSKKFKEVLEKVELVIALDSFMSASTAQADYILPTPTFFERYECVNSIHSENGTLQLSVPAVPPPIYAKHANEVYELILEKLNLRDKQVENQLIEQYHNNPTGFYNNLIKIKTDKTPILYYILQKTIGLKHQTPISSVVWTWLLQYNLKENDLLNAVTLTNKLINQFDKTGSIKINNRIIQTHQIDLSPSFLLSTLTLSKNRLIDSEYNFVLQCGYRQKISLNEVIKNTNEPILEISTNDATDLNIKDNDIVLLETRLTKIKIKCKLINNMQKGLLRIPNHAIINQLTDDNNVDYLSPQYKFVFANIRKINGLS